MPATRTLILTTLAVAPPAYYIYTTINRLEAAYPRLRPEAQHSTAALRSPAFPVTDHTPHVDIYGAKVPAAALRGRHGLDGRALSPEEAWATLFLESPALRLEGKALGSFAHGAGDAGERGFHPRQRLLNGLFEVVRPPSPSSSSATSRFLRPIAALNQPQPLLVRWAFPPQAVGFFHKAAVDWGYPWRLMSGGRQEFAVGEPDGDGMVEVRYACAQDYERVADEGHKQKTIPEWWLRLHRVYAMWLLDERVEALKKRAAEEERREGGL
ncbi:hypothetical protein UCDDS831_g06994 [Diplodia seriata]|uniref:Uncharacterized protein n=1 Tax=Diplodia seriata TaxID=420778 RepID=A0A0G2GHQ2_9PEZI|nr:hypothetical protein UCDDS831_g06994 [Diplodia seriata]